MTRPLRASFLVVAMAVVTAACAGPAASASPTVAIPTVTPTSIAALPSLGPTGAPTEPPVSPRVDEGVVTGNASDKDSGRPVADLQVSIASGGTASCCAEITAPGQYRATLPAGMHELQFSAPGHQPVSRPITLAAGQLLFMNVTLVAGEPSPEPRVTLTIVSGAPAGDPTPVDKVVGGRLSGRLTVSGMLIGRLGGEMQLCAAVLESYPPQCGGPSLLIVGLQVGLLKGLQQANGIVWLDDALTITGDVVQP